MTEREFGDRVPMWSRCTDQEKQFMFAIIGYESEIERFKEADKLLRVCLRRAHKAGLITLSECTDCQDGKKPWFSHVAKGICFRCWGYKYRYPKVGKTFMKKVEKKLQGIIGIDKEGQILTQEV